MEDSDLELPAGRKRKVQVSLRPALARVFRYIVKKERKEMSDIFKDMLEVWISVRHPEKYAKVKVDDDEE